MASVLSDRAVGFLLAIVGNSLIAVSLTLQKSVHKRGDAVASPGAFPNDDIKSLHFLGHPRWWMGVLLMGIGELGNFAAFAFAPASLVAPLGAWSVVLAAMLASSFLGEIVDRRGWVGILLCAGGSVVIGLTGPKATEVEQMLSGQVAELFQTKAVGIYFLLTVCGTAALIVLAHKTSLGERFLLVYIGISSLLGGITVICAKTLSTLLRLSLADETDFGIWLPLALSFVLALAIVVQLKYLNLAMAHYGNSEVVPCYFVTFTLCAVVSSAIVYHEFKSFRITNIPFFGGMASTMLGVWLVAGEKLTPIYVSARTDESSPPCSSIKLPVQGKYAPSERQDESELMEKGIASTEMTVH